MLAKDGKSRRNVVPISTRDITGLILAGGRGSRMGGVDKGLQLLDGAPLVAHTMRRLQSQVGTFAINANRNLSTYETFGAQIWPDEVPDHAGPLAGFLSGLTRCQTAWLLTVPCDTPRFPLDLVRRLAESAQSDGAGIAFASAPEVAPDGAVALRPQPVFCLMRAELRESLSAFVAAGGRKVRAWTSQHRTVCVPFDRPGDASDAFFNANTLEQLQALQTPQSAVMR